MTVNEIMMLFCQNMLLVNEINPIGNNKHYLLLHNHDSDFNDFTILCRDNNGFRLSIKESILISRDSPVLNKNTASIPLLLFD